MGELIPLLVQESMMQNHDNQGFSHDEFKLSKSGFDPAMPGHTNQHQGQMILRQEPRTAKQQGCGISLPYETELRQVAVQHTFKVCNIFAIMI